jgi:hypothetical protein
MIRPASAATPAPRVAVIVDRMSAQQFAVDTIDEIAGCETITVFSCSNTRFKRRLGRHGAYYALNLLTVRNRLTRQVSLSNSRKRIERVVEFESEYDGAWQRLPDPIVDDLASSGFDVILKVGMGLMRVPPPERLPVPILSFHHGDPTRYRGRPAGFWEIVDRRPVIGQVVQVLSNELDAGKVAAFAETRAHPHSYRTTLLEAYGHSRLLINTAIRNALERRFLDLGPKGPNYRLPSNADVARFVVRMAGAFIRRLAYGTMIEKRWRVSMARMPEITAERLLDVANLQKVADWRTIEPAEGYMFYADPFFCRSPRGILLEALSERTGVGEILLVDEARQRAVSADERHFSYPATLIVNGTELVLPETASWSEPAWYRIEDGRMVLHRKLTLEHPCRIVDPTPFAHDGRIFLFGNRKNDGAHALRLWWAHSVDGEFAEHPMSPIRISPRGGRMGGAILRLGDRLFRFGQDFQGGYGDGVILFEILELSPNRYSERELGTIRFRDRRGPHTLNWSDGELLFDWYDDRFAPLAGVRRLRARLRAR